MTPEEELAAIDAEARRRGVTIPSQPSDELSAIEAELAKRGRGPVSRFANNIPPVVAGDAALSLITGAGASVAGGLVGLAQGAANLVSKGGMPAGDRVRQIQEQLTYQPRTELGQDIVDVVSYLPEKLAGAADSAGAAVSDFTGSPAIGAGVNTAIQSIPQLLVSKGVPRVRMEAERVRNARQAELNAQRGRDETRNQVRQDAQDAGMVFAPAEASPGVVNNLLEGIGGKIKTQQIASLKNAKSVDSLVRQELGLADNVPLDADTLTKLRRTAWKAYEDVRTAGRMEADADYISSLDQIKARYEGASKDFGDLAKSEVTDLVDGLKGARAFEADSAIDMIGILREKADKAFRQGDTNLAKANREAANALEDRIGRHLEETGADTQLLQNFRNSRTLIAKSYVVEDAIQGGKINPQKLANADHLTGNLRLIRDAAQQFPKSMQNPSAIGGVPSISPLGMGFTGGIAAILQNPAAFTALGIPPGMRQILTSRSYQQLMVKDPAYAERIFNTIVASSKAASNAPVLPLQPRAQQEMNAETVK